MELLKEALTERGYNTLTSVQEAVIAPELEQRDLLVSAETGSGKTVGFGLAFQLIIAIGVLKIPFVMKTFEYIGQIFISIYLG